MRDLSNHGLAINEARLHLERVHGLDDEREARCLIVTVAGEQMDARRGRGPSADSHRV